MGELSQLDFLWFYMHCFALWQTKLHPKPMNQSKVAHRCLPPLLLSTPQLLNPTGFGGGWIWQMWSKAYRSTEVVVGSCHHNWIQLVTSTTCTTLSSSRDEVYTNEMNSYVANHGQLHFIYLHVTLCCTPFLNLICALNWWLFFKNRESAHTGLYYRWYWDQTRVQCNLHQVLCWHEPYRCGHVPRT